tara:strand:+ start:1363 stop:1935 length:573 start_codon:yes stop_codon:yes gene_type:complete
MEISNFERAVGNRKIYERNDDGLNIMIVQSESNKQSNSDATFNMLNTLMHLSITKECDSYISTISSNRELRKLHSGNNARILVLHAHDESLLDKFFNKKPNLSKLTKQQRENTLVISVLIPKSATEEEKASIAINAIYSEFGHGHVEVEQNENGVFVPLEIDEVFESDFEEPTPYHMIPRKREGLLIEAQ